MESNRILRDIEFARIDGQSLLLDLYLPSYSLDPAPVVVWIHGGAWAVGDKSGCPVGYMASMGYVVASVNYRLSSNAVFPAQIHDCKTAVRWLRKHSVHYRLDTSHFGAWGSSAGGHLAALLGTSAGVKPLEGDLYREESSAVQAVCDWFGPTDFAQMDRHAQSDSVIVHNSPCSPEALLIGGPLEEHADLVALANPANHVTPSAPPFLIMHGELDRVVPYHQSVLLYEALRQAGVPASLLTVEGAGHGFEGFEIGRVVEEFFDQHLKSGRI